jgi:hypothetical protein
MSIHPTSKFVYTPKLCSFVYSPRTHATRSAMMKRGLALGFSIFALIFLSGCIDVEYKLLVDGQDGAELRYTVLMNSLAIGIQSFGADSQDFLKRTEESARTRGYDIAPVAREKATGFTATKKIQGLSRALDAGKDPFGPISDEIPINPGKDLKIWKGLFETEYRLDTVIDLRDPNQGPPPPLPDGESKPPEALLRDLTSAFVKNMRFTFILGLPGKNAISNASSTSNEGSLMTWVLSPGADNPIQANLSVPNRRNIAIAGVLGAALFLALAALVIIVIRRKS